MNFTVISGLDHIIVGLNSVLTPHLRTYIQIHESENKKHRNSTNEEGKAQRRIRINGISKKVHRSFSDNSSVPSETEDEPRRETRSDGHTIKTSHLR